jgi:hypothetical protein
MRAARNVAKQDHDGCDKVAIDRDQTAVEASHPQKKCRPKAASLAC